MKPLENWTLNEVKSYCKSRSDHYKKSPCINCIFSVNICAMPKGKIKDFDFANHAPCVYKNSCGYKFCKDEKCKEYKPRAIGEPFFGETREDGAEPVFYSRYSGGEEKCESK